MNARDLEAALIERCSVAAREQAQAARNQQEANVFYLAAMLVRSRFPCASSSLLQASDRYFAVHPDERLAPCDIVRKGWIPSLPRMRDMLAHRLVGLA